jgi:hypothetical protein
MIVNAPGQGSFSYHAYGIKAPSAVLLRGLFLISIASKGHELQHFSCKANTRIVIMGQQRMRA